ESLLRILLGEIEGDRDRLVEHDVAVHQHGDLPGRVDGQELRAAMVAGEQVYALGFEVDTELLQGPARADRSRRGKLIQLHRLPPRPDERAPAGCRAFIPTTIERAAFRQRRARSAHARRASVKAAAAAMAAAVRT